MRDYGNKKGSEHNEHCEPEQNMFFEPIESVKVHTIGKAQKMDGNLSRAVKRSLMHPQYARRFIRSFVYNLEGGE